MRQTGMTLLPYPDETAAGLVKLYKTVGFDTVIANYELDGQIARKECELALAAGLDIDHIHAPFDAINKMWAPAGDEGAEAFVCRLLDCVDCCSEFGVTKMVLHTSSGKPMPAMNEAGLARYDRVMARADACGVTVAFENQRFLPLLAALMERYPQAGFCWDVGHEHCFTDGVAFLPLYGDRLVCVHLHDNLGTHDQDSHLIPFDGVLNWEEITASLRQVGYTGPLTLENFYCDTKQEQSIYAGVTAETYFARSAAAAMRLRDLMDM